MKNVTMEINYNTLKEIGKLFDLKVNGVKASDLVTRINEKINELKSPVKPGKWYENTELAFTENDIANVNSGWAEGWQVQIIKPSAKKGAYKARRYNPKSGELQGTMVTIDEVDMEKYIPYLPVLVAEVV